MNFEQVLDLAQIQRFLPTINQNGLLLVIYLCWDTPRMGDGIEYGYQHALAVRTVHPTMSEHWVEERIRPIVPPTLSQHIRAELHRIVMAPAVPVGVPARVPVPAAPADVHTVWGSSEPETSQPPQTEPSSPAP